MGKNKRRNMSGLEFKKVAQAILEELYQGAGGGGGRFSDGGDFRKRESYGEMSGDFGQRTKRSGDSGRDVLGFENQAVDDASSWLPKTERRDFLSQRLQRRNVRGDEFGLSTEPDVQNASGAVVVVDSPGHIAGAEFSERMSEFYCRDARRYDGAFERF